MCSIYSIINVAYNCALYTITKMCSIINVACNREALYTAGYHGMPLSYYIHCILYIQLNKHHLMLATKLLYLHSLSSPIHNIYIGRNGGYINEF